MKLRKTLVLFCLMAVGCLLNSCTLVKLIYNQFSDEEEFILFNNRGINTDTTATSGKDHLFIETNTKYIKPDCYNFVDDSTLNSNFTINPN